MNNSIEEVVHRYAKSASPQSIHKSGKVKYIYKYGDIKVGDEVFCKSEMCNLGEIRGIITKIFKSRQNVFCEIFHCFSRDRCIWFPENIKNIKF